MSLNKNEIVDKIWSYIGAAIFFGIIIGVIMLAANSMKYSSGTPIDTGYDWGGKYSY